MRKSKELLLPLIPEKKRKLMFWIVCGVVFLTVAIILFLLRHSIENFVQNVRFRLDELYRFRPKFVLFLFFAASASIQLFCLPGMTLVIASGAYVIRNTITSFFFFLIISVFVSSIAYAVTKKFLFETINERFGNSAVFLTIKNEMQRGPVKLSFLARFLMIPNGLKDYMLALIDDDFQRFISCAAVTNALFTLEDVMIGVGLRILDSPEPRLPWKHKPLSEKLMAVFYVVILVVAILAMTIVGKKATRILMNPDHPVVAPDEVYNILRTSINELRNSKKSPSKRTIVELPEI